MKIAALNGAAVEAINSAELTNRRTPNSMHRSLTLT